MPKQPMWRAVLFGEGIAGVFLVVAVMAYKENDVSVGRILLAAAVVIVLVAGIAIWNLMLARSPKRYSNPKGEGGANSVG